ncbi:MAG: sigma-70 family RNA polymerase sigma factor [Planctomycetota bacterium]|nr:sigma-70 family RNA polymerase sigma factor [Planctomycetota bacterium]
MSSVSTRWTVIRRAAQGIPADQAEFVGRYGSVIRAYLVARWRHTALFDQVEDAAQQVLLDCFKKDGALSRADPDRETGFRAFLYGVVRNVALTVERKRARTRERQTTSSVDLEAFESKEDSCATVFDREWARTLLRDAAEVQLARARKKGPDATRRHRLLALRYGENLAIREIAARWEMDAAVLHREYPKAREEFKRALMDVVRDLQGGGPEAVDEECTRLLGCFS